MRDIWPLFGLSIETDEVTLRLPADDEIAALAHLAAAGVHDPVTRPFLTSWADGTPKERALNVLRQHWTDLGSWSADRWQIGFGVFVEDEPVGIVSLRATNFPVVREVMSSSWLGLAHQGKNFGTQARQSILALAFEYLEAQAALSEVFQDNYPSQAVSRKLGYIPDGTLRSRRGDEAVTSDRLRLTARIWKANNRATSKVTGFEACRSTFGV